MPTDAEESSRMRYRPIRREEAAALAEIQSRSFRFDPTRLLERIAEGSHRFSPEDGRVIEDGERGLVAGMTLFERPSSLQGHELATGLINAVGVPPEHRRRGYAAALMEGGLREMRERELPLSLLFPYSIPFYNRLGYGICSHLWLLELELAEMEDFDEIRLVRRLTPEDLPAMQALYRRVRRQQNGWLERRDWEWHERVLDLPGNLEWPKRVEGVAVPGADGRLRGYLTFLLAKRSDGPQALTIREWVSEDDEAWRALAGFTAAQRAQAHYVRYGAPEGFPLVHALRERNAYRHRRETEFAWRDTLSMGGGLMLRLIHLDRALTQRPYPADVSGECVVQMRDDQLPANEQPLHLRVEGGRATTAPADDGAGSRASADSRTWAELYANTLTPVDARRLGRLEADDQSVAFLGRALAAEPWFIHEADWF